MMKSCSCRAVELQAFCRRPASHAQQRSCCELLGLDCGLGTQTAAPWPPRRSRRLCSTTTKTPPPSGPAWWASPARTGSLAVCRRAFWCCAAGPPAPLPDPSPARHRLQPAAGALQPCGLQVGAKIPGDAWEYQIRKSLNDAAYNGLDYVPYCSLMPIPKEATEEARFMWVSDLEQPAAWQAVVEGSCRLVCCQLQRCT